MKKFSSRQMAYAGILTALVLLLTLYVHLPVPMTHGYVHLGDAAVLLCGILLGPLGFVPAALGSALADLTSGFAIYALPSLAIKGLMALLIGACVHKQPKLSLRNVAMLVLAQLLMVAGYFVFELLVFGWVAATASLLGNFVQALAGVALGAALLSFASRIRID